MTVPVRALSCPLSPLRVLGVKNLSRNEAAERAALLRVESYEVRLDLTAAPSATRFGTGTRVVSECRRNGADMFVEHEVPVWESAVLDGVPLDLGTVAGNRLPLRGLSAGRQTSWRCGALADYSVHRRGAAPVRRPGRRRGLPLRAVSFLDDAQRMFACFDQPDLKAPFTLDRPAPADWVVVGNDRGRPDATAAGWAFAPTDADLDVPVHASPPGRTTSRAASTAGSRWACCCRAVAAPSTSTPRRGLARGHRAEPRPPTHGAVRHPLPVRRPTTRSSSRSSTPARWRTPGCVTFTRRLPVPVAATPDRAAAAGRRVVAARDGAHVVRRPGHHALVGRPLAQRVVRRAARHADRGRGDRPAAAAGPRSPSAARPGATRPTSCRPPTPSPPRSLTRRARCSTSTGSATRRAPRCCAS